MNNIQALNTRKLLEIGPKISSLLLVVLIAYTLVQMLWLFVETDVSPIGDKENRRNTVTPSHAKSSSQITTANKIAASNLYGVVDYSAPVQQSVIEAPETTLNLKLMGILATGGKDGLAIIASNNNEELYRVGSKVPGNATLKQVLADRVILESNRGLETLRLPVEKGNGISIVEDRSIMPKPQPFTSTREKPIERKLHDYRKQFIRDPASIGQFAEVQPVQGEGGKFQGYKITPKSEQALFAEVGLQDGDIITGVNGIELDQPAKGLSALRKLMNAKELNLTVLRNGQAISIQRSFDR